MSCIPLISILLFLAGAPTLFAQAQLLGAKQSIASIKQALQASTTNTVAAGQLTTEAFEKQIEDYRRDQPRLSQDKQIQGWLSLARLINRVQISKHCKEMSGEDALNQAFTHLLDALPPTESWKCMQQAFQQEAALFATNAITHQADSSPGTGKTTADTFGSAAEYNLAYQYVFACLLNDRAAFREVIKTMQKKHEGIHSFWMNKADVAELMMDEDEQATSRVTIFERMLQTQSPRDYIRTPSRLPDILSTVGYPRAEAIAKRLMTLTALDHRSIQHYGFKTKEAFILVQTVALSMLDELSEPCWELVDNSKTGWTLYQALKQKFMPSAQGMTTQTNEINFVEENNSPASDSFINASAGAIQYLIENKNMDAAIELTLTFSRSKLTNLSGFNNLINSVCHDSPESDTTLYTYLARITNEMGDQSSLFDIYIEKGLASGHRQDVEDQLNTRLNYPKIARQSRLALLNQKLSITLAEDRNDESAALIRQVLNESKRLRRLQSDMNIFDHSEFLSKAILQTGLMGQLDLQKACITQLMDLLLEQLADPRNNCRRRFGSVFDSNDGTQILQALKQHDQLPTFEHALTQSIVQSYKRTDSGVRFTEEPDNSELLFWLVRLYDFTGRTEDVLTLLEEAPWWGPYRDVTEFYDSSIGPVITRALLCAGRTAEATQFLTAKFAKNHSQDWMYESLLQLTGTNLHVFVQEMDRLYATDAFEERPLIWKAEALRRLKNLKEAENTIRLALKIDPTDGEQKENDRVRGYAVLADILTDQGKKDDAKFFRDVVQAVRLAEEGDRLESYGFIKRSLARYAEAEKLFSDAYCVQWRLAERLSQLGQDAEAEKHYAIAFERMPEQFGQVASLCFGCEGVFKKKSSRSVGERVLLRLANQPNPRPTVFYLLGQLRESQDQFDEAYSYFKKASEMDAGYLDALTRMIDLCQDQVTRPLKEMQTLQLKILNLDPLGNHSNFEILEENLAEFWKIRNTAIAQQAPLPKTTLVLKANVDRIENEKNKQGSYFYYREIAQKTAAEVYLESKKGRFLHTFMFVILRPELN